MLASFPQAPRIIVDCSRLAVPFPRSSCPHRHLRIDDAVIEPPQTPSQLERMMPKYGENDPLKLRDAPDETRNETTDRPGRSQHGLVRKKSSRVATVLKVRRCIDLRRCVVALEGALEGRAAGHGAAGIGLLGRAAVVHQAVVLVLVLLAAPDPPGDQRQTAEDDGAADADNDADDGVAGLGRHA